jgi:teichuronic acid biosynthesis glycosyltransferase TuaC
MCINDNQFVDKNLLVITPAYPNEDDSYIGGSFVKNQLNILKKHFNEIIVISPVPFSFKQLSKDKFCDDYSYDNIKVYYPRSFYVPILYFRKLLVDNRLRVVDSLIQRKNLNFDLIHAHFTWPSAYIAADLKEKYKKPVVVTIHENSDGLYEEVNMNYPLLNQSWENADALIRVNKIDVPLLKRFNDNVFFVPNGFSSIFKPMDKYECRKKLGLHTNTKIIFSLGLLIERKGFQYLIEAMKFVEDERFEVLCFIGGSGPLKSKLQKKIDNLNLTDKVKLIGFIPDEALPLWMNACDIFVLPSLSESFGVVLIEAMACGKPVISTYNGGSEEIVISEDYGLLVESRSSKQLSEKIMISLDHKWDVSKILNYVEHFNLNYVVEKILTVYRGIP